MLFRQFFDWITVKDYVNAKNAAAVEVAARFSRGNIAVQNGWFIDEARLKDLTLSADRAMDNLRLKKKVVLK